MDVSRITEDEVRRVLACVRGAAPLGGCPLLELHVLQARLSAEGMRVSPEGLEWALGAVVADLIHERLTACRVAGGEPADGPPPLAEHSSRAPRGDRAVDDLAPGLRADFAAGDIVREAWSALYYRYVCRSGIRAEEIAALAVPGLAHGDRHVRRRLARGVTALTAALREIELREETPPAPRHNLPHDLTRFIDRCREADAVRALLAAHRLVTLTGPGGIGKSRLAVEVARDLVARHRDGAWLVELVGLDDEAQVPRAIAAALDIRDQSRRLPADAVVAQLARKDLLLVLDNCEHLRDACAAIVDKVLAGCPGVRVLATSRERLRVPGEAVWAVPPLPVPPAPNGAGDGYETADGHAPRSPAVCLFADRAASSVPGFTVSAANVRDVVAVCRGLDGLPLAIELAASRLRVLSASEVAARLGERLDLLRDGRSIGHPHHQTLRAVMDWSHDLLSTGEAVLFRRLSVFRAPWTIEDAEAVCGGEPLAEGTVADLVGALVDKSLVTLAARLPEPRWRMLETVAQYAAERLNAGGETSMVRDRHLAVLAAHVETTIEELSGRAQAACLDRLEAEHLDLLAALAWACEGGDVVTGMRMGGRLLSFWLDRGYWHEGREVLARLTTSPGAERDDYERARAMDARGVLARCLGEYDEARALHEAALEICRREGNEGAAAAVLCRLGNVADAQGRMDEARVCYEESLAINRRLGNVRGVASLLGNLGCRAYDQGEYATADDLLREALSVHRTLGDPGDAARYLSWLAAVAKARGDVDRARALWEESRATFHDLGNKNSEAEAMADLGDLARAQGDLDRAESLFAASLAAFREVGNQACAAVTTLNLGSVARIRGDLATARERYAECLRLQVAIGERLYLSFALDDCAKLAVAEGDPGRAARLAGAADAIRAALGAAQPPDLGAELERDLAPARAALGEEEFAAQWAVGRGMGVREAVDAALVGPSTAR